jgi:hypothetical protein
MEKLITLGRASEETKGFESRQFDPQTGGAQTLKPNAID